MSIRINDEKCVGCGQCVALCQYDAAQLGEGDTSERLNYKIAEYSLAVVKKIVGGVHPA